MITIDGYEQVERIGRGGLGDVYRATRVSTGATVAIKVLRDVSDESVAWHRTRRELTALVALAGHANVVQLIEVLDLHEGPALVMEYAPRGSVADLLVRRDDPLSVAETVHVGRQTASALVAAHAQGIVHRDVKPQNLLIDAYGQVKLCDFGIAAMARSEEFRARTSAVSMRYASPEDLDDEVDVGPASDVYSLGATMLHLARGAPPTLKERLTGWRPPSTTDADLAVLDAVMADCLEPEPSARPSAVDVADRLERLGWSLDDRNRTGSFDPSGFVGDPTGGPAEAAGDGDPTVRRQVGGPGGAIVESQDDTVHRPDRRMPSPPVTRRRRWPIAVGVVLAAVVAAVAVRAVREGDDADAVAADTVDRPAGLRPITDLDWPLGDVGECLVQVGEQVVSVSCSEPHDLQRIAVGTLAPDVFGPDVAFDRGAAEQAVRVACSKEFESVVGDTAGLEGPFSLPSADSWAREDDRTYQCLVGVEGRRLVGEVIAGPD